MNKYNVVRIFLSFGLIGVVVVYTVSYDFLQEATVIAISIFFGFIINEVVYSTNKHRYEKNKEALFKLFPKTFIPKNKYIEDHKAIIKIKKYFKTVKAKEVKGKYGEALQYLRAGLETISEPVLVESLSMLLYSNGEIQKAIDNLKSMKPKTVEADKNRYNLLSVCYNKTGDYHHSLQCLTKVSELLQTDIEEKVRNLSDIAECYYNLDKKAEASPFVREAYKLARKHNYIEGKLYIHRILLNYYHVNHAITDIAKILNVTYALLKNKDISGFDNYGLVSISAIFEFERKLVVELLRNEKIRQSLLDHEFSTEVLNELKNFFTNREENSKQLQGAIISNLKSVALVNLDHLS